MLGIFSSLKKEGSEQLRKENNCDLLEMEEILAESEKLGYNAHEINWIVSKNTEKAKRLVEIFDDIYKKLRKNSSSLESGSLELEDLSKLASIINENAVEVLKMSKESLEKVRQGSQAIVEVQNLIARVSEEMDGSAEDVDGLQELIEKIADFVNFIKEIARQTQLLSLNAGIEAARAGQAGRGFGVVASEIRKMAEMSNVRAYEIQEAAVFINEGIGKLQQIFKENAARLRDVRQKTQLGMNTMDESVGAFEEIARLNDMLFKSIARQTQATTSLSNIISSLSKETLSNIDSTGKVEDLIKEQGNNNALLLKIAEKLAENVYALQKKTLKLKKKDELIIGINPALSPDVIKAMYLPVISAAGEKAGYTFRVLIAADYNSLADCLIEGIVDIGWFSPLAYVNAKNKADIIQIVTPVVNNAPFYRGYIVAAKGSKILSIKDLRGKRVGFVDPKSASGYIYPRMLLKMSGIDPDRDLLEKVFFGTHSRVVEAVINGTVDAGATYSEALEEAQKRGLKVETLICLAETDPIPKDCIAARPGMDQNVVERIKEGFLTYKQSGYGMGSGTNINGFIEARDENYDIIRAVLKDAG